MLLLAVSKFKFDQLSEIRKTTVYQRKSLLSTAQETNSDWSYTTLNALKHLSMKAQVFELQLFFRIFFMQLSTDNFCGQMVLRCSLSSEVILSAAVLRSFLTIRWSLSDNFNFQPDLCFMGRFLFFFKNNHYF